MKIGNPFRRMAGKSPLSKLMAAAAGHVEKGDYSQALESYSRIVNLDPSSAEGHYRRGNILNRMGRLEEALADYDRATLLKPEYAHAWCNRGAVLERAGRLEEALVCQERAIAIDDQDHLAHYNRGSVLAALGRLEEAVRAFDAAIALKADYFEALLNRGNALAGLHRRAEAIASYDAALQLNRSAAEAHLGRGVMFVERHRWDEAIQAYGMAIEVKSDFAAAFHNRGNVHLLLRRFDLAFADFQKRIELEPESAIGHEALGDAAINLRRFREAIASYDRALVLDPESKYLRGRRRHFKMQYFDWSGLDEDLAWLRRAIEAGKPVCTPFHALTLFDDASLHKHAADAWVSRECLPDSDFGPTQPIVARERIRIAYFSADFRHHAVSILAAHIFSLHDRSSFEVLAFAYGPAGEDSMTRHLRTVFDKFFDIHNLDDEAVVRMCRKLGVDIAVDLGGYTEYARSKIFSMRAAPVQVGYLGYPGTSGASFMDYLVCDETVVPNRLALNYSEKRILLPHSYLPHDSERTASGREWTRAECGLPESAFVFCAFHGSYKILPATFDTWMRVLLAVPHSVLWLAEAAREAGANLRGEAERRGVDPTRLVFAPRLPSIADHLTRQRLADLFLDTLPYNAHSTALDALWIGLPVLTLIGEAFAGRVGASVLRAVGMPELIATTPIEYERTAIKLAHEPAAIAAVKDKLMRLAKSSPLFDSRKQVRHLEAAYAQIVRRHELGLVPEDIRI